MTFEENIEAGFRRTIQLLKARTGDLTALSTTAKSDLVSAINEIVDANLGINDNAVTTTSAYSSSKVTNLLSGKLSINAPIAASLLSGTIDSARLPDFSLLPGKPTTISGYGIIDALSAAGSYPNPTWITSLAAAKITGLATVGKTGSFSDLINKPTTVAGYGITDVVSASTKNVFATSSELAAFDSTITKVTLLDGRIYNKVTSARAIDGVTSITVQGDSTKRWILDANNVINVKWFGAIGNGLVDDAPAIQSAIDYAKFVQIQNGGDVRISVLIPSGIYLLFAPLNLTNINGFTIKGIGGKYVNTQLVGITGSQIFDCTGATAMLIDGFTFISDHNWLAGSNVPSTIGIQIALSSTNSDGTGTQIGGLNSTITNCFFQMDDYPTANGGYGTIAILNVRGEEFSLSNTVTKSNVGLFFSNNRDLSACGHAFTVTSSFANVMAGSGSMGVVDIGNNVSLENFEKRSPALILYNTNSVRFHGYMARVSNALGLAPETAIELYGQNDNIKISGTIESFATAIKFGTFNSLIDIDLVVANEISNGPLSAVPLVITTGSAIYDSKIAVNVNIPSEYNNGRFFLYHAPVGSGDSPATGTLQNCITSSTGWVNNANFVSSNLLKSSTNTTFNSGQPFKKQNLSIIDLKAYPKNLGTLTSGNPAITGTIIRFLKADKATPTVGNGGFYQAIIRGVIKAGNIYTTGGNCVVDFESRCLVSQNPNGNLNAVDSSTIIHNKSVTSPSFIDITDISAAIDLTGSFGEIKLTIGNAGTALGEPVTFIGNVELISDFAVNQSVLFD